MTKEEFRLHLRNMIKRLRADLGFRGLSFFNKHQVSQLDTQFDETFPPDKPEIPVEKPLDL